MENPRNRWLGTFMGQLREAGTPAPKRRIQDLDDEVDMAQCAKRPRLENGHAGIENSLAQDTNRISAYYAHTNVPQNSGAPLTYSSDPHHLNSRPSADSLTVNSPSVSHIVRQPTHDNRAHGAYTSPYQDNTDLARSLAQRQQIASNLAKIHSSPSKPVGTTTHQANGERDSSPASRAPAGMVQRQTHQVLGHGHAKIASPLSNGHGQISPHHEQREGGSTSAPLSRTNTPLSRTNNPLFFDKSVISPPHYQHKSSPQTYISTDAHHHSSEQPFTQSMSSQDSTKAPPSPRVPTYYEHTGGTHNNLPPSISGVYANQDFKTGKFIDGHGAPFSNDRSGPFRYLKPINRGMELAVMQATYQTIADFELYMGCSPSCLIETWESYEKQYQQLQKHLEEVWVGSPDSIPKLKCIEGWNASHFDHVLPAPLAADTIPPWFIRCQPGVTISQPCCIEHERETWTGLGCVRNLENRMWQDWGNEYFSGLGQ